MTAPSTMTGMPFGASGPGGITDPVEKRAMEALTAKGKDAVSNLDKDLREHELALERRKSEQDLRRQIVQFRKYLLLYLIVFMTLESIALFAIVVLASLRILAIGDATLQILVGATIAQISAMLIVIVRSVYSDSLNKIIMSKDPVSIPR